MRKKMRKVLLLTAFAVFLAGAAAAQVSRGSTAYVTAKTVQVKSSTGFFAGSRGTLSYGAQVAVLQVNGKWAEIRSAGSSPITGWIASSNLTTRRISASGAGTSASASEIALAGKGFNEEVENAYKAGGNLNYADVDKTETLQVSPEDLYQFVTEGHLAAGEN
jgi:polyisoprenoid-binding protein YceI